MNLDSLDLFFGDANPAQARVYARCAGSNGAHLNGHLIGPTCHIARTLPARIPFAELSSSAGEGRAGGSAAFAEAIIPDPCFWTPELPFVYQAELELRHDNKIAAAAKKLFGLRRLAVRDRTLQFDGKRFVLRGARLPGATPGLPSGAAEFARETWTAIVVETPSDEFCEFASRQGVLLVADLRTENSNLENELRRLAQWPAVGIALLDQNASLPAEIHNLAPNLLLAEYFPNARPLKSAPWAQIAAIEVTDSSDIEKQIAGCNLPIIALRPAQLFSSIEQSRAACDTLQSELVSRGEFAGYIV